MEQQPPLPPADTQRANTTAVVELLQTDNQVQATVASVGSQRFQTGTTSGSGEGASTFTAQPLTITEPASQAPSSSAEPPLAEGSGATAHGRNTPTRQTSEKGKEREGGSLREDVSNEEGGEASPSSQVEGIQEAAGKTVNKAETSSSPSCIPGFVQLPVEVVLQIFACLNLVELDQVTRVCHNWQAIVVGEWGDDLLCKTWSDSSSLDVKEWSSGRLLRIKHSLFHARIVPLLGDLATNAQKIKAIPTVSSQLRLTARGIACLPDCLVTLKLTKCNHLKDVSPLSRLTALKALSFIECTKVAHVASFPSTLTSLQLFSVEKVPFSVNYYRATTKKELLNHLTVLQQSSCDSLKKLPTLPAGLTKLDIRGYSAITALGALGSRLQTLALNGCSGLKTLPVLQPSLSSLHLMGCQSLHRLPVLPSTLRNLCMQGCIGITQLPTLPSSLYNLNMAGCDRITRLNELPPQLHWLDVAGCLRLSEVPALHPNSYLGAQDCLGLVKIGAFPSCVYQVLNLSGCTNLEQIAELPNNITELNVSSCNKLRRLPKLPYSLKKLNAWGCPLEELPTLPEGLEELTLHGAVFSRLPALPKSLKSLTCQRAVNLHEVLNLPEKLERLDFYGCSKLQRLLMIPQTVSELILCKCVQLQAIPQLPPQLTELDLTRCERLSALPALPSSLEMLELYKCRSLLRLPQLPSSLEYLGLEKCTNLQALPEQLPSQLKNLDLSGCVHVTTLPVLPQGLESLYVLGCRIPLSEIVGSLPTSLSGLGLNCSSKLLIIPLSTQIQDLSLQGAQGLRTLPRLPGSLKSLHLEKWPSLTALPLLPQTVELLFLRNCATLSSLGRLPTSLNNLTLSNCPQLDDRVFGQLPASLHALEVKNNESLNSLKGLPKGLSYLTLSNCPQLDDRVFEQLPASLKCLTLKNCQRITARGRAAFRKRRPECSMYE